jgi:phosphoserine phosphatase
VVDFDGTMHLHDSTWVGMRWLFFYNIVGFFRAAIRWRPSTRAPLKMVLAAYTEEAQWSPTLTWDNRVLELMETAKAEGREVIVVTGSIQRFTERILEAKGLVYPVMGTQSPGINLINIEKTKALVKRYGEKGFDYIGNSRQDLPVWAAARAAMVVNASLPIEVAAKALGNVAFVLPPLK